MTMPFPLPLPVPLASPPASLSTILLYPCIVDSLVEHTDKQSLSRLARTGWLGYDVLCRAVYRRVELRDKVGLVDMLSWRKEVLGMIRLVSCFLSLASCYLVGRGSHAEVDVAGWRTGWVTLCGPADSY
jgi:hypothetical protein